MSLFLLCLFVMVNINIGTINIIGPCTDAKRASLFKLCELKKLEVLFVQDTHSDSKNEGDWRREWPGQVFLSHIQSNSTEGHCIHCIKKIDTLSHNYEKRSRSYKIRIS